MKMRKMASSMKSYGVGLYSTNSLRKNYWNALDSFPNFEYAMVLNSPLRLLNTPENEGNTDCRLLSWPD